MTFWFLPHLLVDAKLDKNYIEERVKKEWRRNRNQKNGRNQNPKRSGQVLDAASGHKWLGCLLSTSKTRNRISVCMILPMPSTRTDGFSATKTFPSIPGWTFSSLWCHRWSDLILGNKNWEMKLMFIAARFHDKLHLTFGTLTCMNGTADSWKTYVRFKSGNSLTKWQCPPWVACLVWKPT